MGQIKVVHFLALNLVVMEKSKNSAGLGDFTSEFSGEMCRCSSEKYLGDITNADLHGSSRAYPFRILWYVFLFGCSSLNI